MGHEVLKMRQEHPKAEVLLSSYNGEKFLREQLDSILSQTYPDLALTIRDDGSTDGTRDILRDYRTQGVSVREGDNIGVVRSFFTLLEMSSPEAGYYFFADQDDVWLGDKVARAIACLEARDRPDLPMLYCSRVRIVDESLNERGPSPLPRRGAGFVNALVENIATGCTVALNRAARDLLVREFPIFANNHDWWSYQVVSAFGTVFYDPRPSLLYRQHGANVTGMADSGLKRLARKFARQLGGGNRGVITRQAAELKRLFAESMPPENRRLLENFLLGRPGIPARASYILSSPLHRQSSLDTVAFRVLYVLGRI